MRNIADVIDQLVEVMPKDDPAIENMNRVKSDASFTAPEIMQERWAQLAEVLDGRFKESFLAGEETDLVQKTLKIFNDLK